MANTLLTVDEAAEALKLHPKTVLRHIREGRLEATRIGKAYRIDRSKLDAFAGLAQGHARPGVGGGCAQQSRLDELRAPRLGRLRHSRGSGAATWRSRCLPQRRQRGRTLGPRVDLRLGKPRHQPFGDAGGSLREAHELRGNDIRGLHVTSCCV